MNEEQHIPLSLRIVAILFILAGVHSVIQVIVDLIHSKVSINLGVLGLFIGPGLLALRPGWRTCALVFIWIAMIGIPISTVLMLSSSAPLTVSVFGQKLGHAPRELGIVAALAFFSLSVWQYRVLTEPSVRKLFGVQTG